MFSTENLQHLWNDQGYIVFMTNIGSRIRAFNWCHQNRRPWMTLKGHYALCFKTRASFGAHHENLNKYRVYYQRRSSCFAQVKRVMINDARFWQYKVCWNIYRGFLERWRQTTVGLSKNGNFQYFLSLFLVKLDICVHILWILSWWKELRSTVKNVTPHSRLLLLDSVRGVGFTQPPLLLHTVWLSAPERSHALRRPLRPHSGDRGCNLWCKKNHAN